MGRYFSLFFISFFSAAVFAAVPQQLNTLGFAGCFKETLSTVNFGSAIYKNVLFPGDWLLPYLSVYAGKRLPVIGGLAQDRWSGNYATVEENLASRLYSAAAQGNKLFPNVIYGQALQACGAEAFCAGLISHNVLRTLGRSETAYHYNVLTNQMDDLNPEWFKRDRESWLQKAKVIQQAMISLHRDGSNDRWGDNYHFFGLFTFSLHEMALYHNVSFAWLASRANQFLNPLLAGGPEDPAKAVIDRNSIDVSVAYFLNLGAVGLNCTDARAYRLGP